MNNVIDALRYMAKFGGCWNCGKYAGIWYIGLNNSRSYSNDGVGFTQEEMRAFLEHYDEVTRER